MTAPPAKIAELRARALAVNMVAVPLTILMVGVAVIGVMMLPYSIPVGRFEMVWCLAAILALLALHELLPALPLVLFADLPWSAFKFGFCWRQLVAYCHCRQPVPMRAYRYCTLAPLAVLGPLTILTMLCYPAIWLALATAVHLSGCLGDIWMFLCSLRFPDHFLFLDFPDKIGGEVLQPAVKSTPNTALVNNGMVVK